MAKSKAESQRRTVLKKEKLKESMAREIANIETRKGTKCQWSDARVAAMDEMCLKEGKRCVMWSDEGSGWYALINWDWSTNLPAVKETSEEEYKPGYYEDLRKTLQPPLLADVPPEHLDAWLRKNTVSVHHTLIERLGLDGDEQH